MMKLSDYLIEFLENLGVKHVFFLPGGGAMHMNDSLGKSKKITEICMLHEQAASVAAEAYARISQGLSVCLVTSGPGVTNAISGLAGAWLDSTPVLFISGQAKRADLVGEQGIRQFGIQEINAVSLVSSLTKYAVQINEPHTIKYELEKAVSIAMDGRPGPVWVDIPIDVQASQIDIQKLPSYEPRGRSHYECSQTDMDKVIAMLNEAERPVLLVGNGIRLAGADVLVRQLYDELGIPVLTTWNGVDLIEDIHPLYFGRPGASGQRHANFIQQNSDVFLSIGTRLNLLSTGFDFDSFLASAKHIMVDIDKNECEKKSLHPALSISCDAKSFINLLLKNKDKLVKKSRQPWLEHCQRVKDKYPLCIPEQNPQEGFVNTYRLIDEISNQMAANDIYQFTSSGTCADIAMQAFKIKLGQRAFLTKGLASMGFDLPAAIGSCIASGGRRTVCATGDGGFAMNIQELETLRRLNLPVKMFVVDNSGYSMIYTSQKGSFDNRLTGCNKESGLTLPNYLKVADAFGITTFLLEKDEAIVSVVSEVLKFEGPAVCVVKGDIAQLILPRQTNYKREDGQMASRPLQDMSPLLDREEYKENLIAGR